MKKIACSLLVVFVLLCSVCVNTGFVNAEDNETDLISLKNTVTLKLKYNAEYKYGYTPLIPESALVNESFEEISIGEVDVLYESTDEAGYSSEIFPTEVGSYKVTWTVKEDNVKYQGSGVCSFEIVEETLDGIDQRDIESYGFESARDVPSGLWVSNIEDKAYAGSKTVLSNDELRVYCHTRLLTLNSDYTVKYLNNTKVGTATVVITGKGNYAGSINKTFNIIAQKVVLNSISDVYLVYNVKGVSVSVPKVSFNKTALKNNVDYTYTIDGEKPGKLYEAKDYEVVISPVGGSNYTFDKITYTVHVQSTVNKYKIASAKITGLKSSLNYSGDQLEQELVLTYKNGKNTITLQEGEDYSITYLNNKEIGTATMIIAGMNDYYGVVVKTYKINGIQLSKARFELDGIALKSIPNQVFNGSEIRIVDKDNQSRIGLYYQSNTKDPSTRYDLIEGKDYTVSYSNNVNVGTATITYTGINGYTGSVKKTFKIAALALGDKTGNKYDYVDFDEIGVQTYLKGGVKPLPHIVVNGKTLVLNKDYTLSYSNNSAVSDGSGKKKTAVTVKGKGNYSGSIVKEFTIVSGDISELNITVSDMLVSTKANQYKAAPVITDKDGKVLKAGTDYDKNIIYRYNSDCVVINSKTKAKEIRAKNDAVSATDIIPAGTVIRVTVNGIKNYTGVIEKTFRIYSKSISKIKFKINPQVYTGEPVYIDKKDIIITSKESIDSDCYEIVSYSNNINKGTASLTIKGIGNYGGTVVVKFNITARSVSA